MTRQYGEPGGDNVRAGCTDEAETHNTIITYLQHHLLARDNDVCAHERF